jgi:hypothetical protein
LNVSGEALTRHHFRCAFPRRPRRLRRSWLRYHRRMTKRPRLRRQLSSYRRAVQGVIRAMKDFFTTLKETYSLVFDRAGAGLFRRKSLPRPGR